MSAGEHEHGAQSIVYGIDDVPPPVETFALGLQHLHDLEPVDKFDRSPKLLNPTTTCRAAVAHKLRAIAAIPDGIPVIASRRARCHDMEVCHVRDVVLYCGHGGGLVVGQVWFFFQYECNPPLALIECWPTVSKEPASGSATVQMDQRDVIITPASDIMCALVYKCRQDGNANVLVPTLYRALLRSAKRLEFSANQLGISAQDEARLECLLG